MKNDELKMLPGKKYNSQGMKVRLRAGNSNTSIVNLLAMYAGMSMAEVRKVGTERDCRLLERGRMIRSRLASAVSNPRDLSKTRRELLYELTEEDENGVPKMTPQNAHYLIRTILAAMAEAESLDRKTHRMVLERRNQRAWEIAEEQKDVAAMNAADKNYIAIHQLEQEDVEHLDADKIQVQNLMVTVNYNQIMPDSGASDDPWKDINRARKLATAGIISLKDEKDAKKYLTTDIDDFEEITEDPSPTLPNDEDETDGFDYQDKPL